MDSSEITKLIQKDVAVLQNRFKETTALFLEPRLCQFEDFSGNLLNLWAILKKEEYLITFDEKTGRYGLAFKNIFNDLVFLGDYKSLSDTYENLISRD
jgi:hypothetical protein